MRHNDVVKDLIGIVLAAGQSERMGRPKQLLPFGISTVLQTTVSNLQKAGMTRVAVVVAHDADEIARIASDSGAEIVVNPSPTSGMLSSVQCAVREQHREAEGWVFALSDMPLVRPDTIRTIIKAFDPVEPCIVIPILGERRGHPIAVCASFAEAILALPPQLGLNSLVREKADWVRLVAVSDPGILKDLDTPAEYQQAIEANEPGE